MTRKINKIIAADLYRYLGKSGTKAFIQAFFIPGFRFIFFHRKASFSKKYSFSGIFYRLLLRRYSYKYGFQIPTSTQIGEGFLISHFGSIVINENTRIGKNCNITHGVTIGRTNRGKLKGSPVLGDKVWIGANVVIVGKITIGTNVLIAPNSFVNFNVPDNSLVIGNPALILSKENATEGYIGAILPA
jgi:serine O-acetyltransferase